MSTSVKGGMVRSIPKNVEESRTIPFIISDTSKDRHNTVLSIEGWALDSFKRNGIVGYMHSVYGGNLISDPNPDMIIGKGRAFVEGKNLIGDTTFESEDINPFAEKIFRKVLFGSLNSCSVGFSELTPGTYGTGTEAKGKADETYYFGRRELLEYSIVNIPSNRNSLKRTIRDEPEGVQRYASMMLGKKMSDSQIKNLTIEDALSLLEGRELEINATDPAAVRRMIEGYKFMNKRVDTLETQNRYLKNTQGSTSTVSNDLNISTMKTSEKEERELKKFSIIKFLREAGNRKLTGLESEMNQEGTRALLLNGHTPRGFVVPEIILSRASTGQNISTAGDGGVLSGSEPVRYIEALKNALILPAMGATYLPGLVGTLPLVGGGAFLAEWATEGVATEISKENLSKKIMSAKRLTANGAFSKELLLQASVYVEDWVMRGLARANAQALLSAVIYGEDPAPVGILNTEGIGSVAGGINGLAAAWSHIIELESIVANANGDIGRPGYIINSKVRSKLKQTLRAAGLPGYLIEGDLLNGFKCGVSNAVPSTLTKGTSEANCSGIIFGNWEDLIIGDWGGLDIIVDNYSSKLKGEVEITVNTFADIAIGNPASFSAMVDVLTT